MAAVVGAAMVYVWWRPNTTIDAPTVDALTSPTVDAPRVDEPSSAGNV